MSWLVRERDDSRPMARLGLCKTINLVVGAALSVTGVTAPDKM